jgi:hypothetical protein
VLLTVGVLLTALGQPSLLGSELREDNYALRPPAGFTVERMESFAGTRAASIGLATGAKALSAVLVDSDGPDAAAMLIGEVDGAFDGHPASRDELSGAVVRHFTEELAFPFTLESARAASGRVPRIEVLGTLRQEGQARHVLVAALAGEPRHAVITFSVPSGRYQALAPALEASLDTFSVETPAGRPFSRGFAGALTGAIAGALVVSLALWRRRPRRQVLRGPK